MRQLLQAAAVVALSTLPSIAYADSPSDLYYSTNDALLSQPDIFSAYDDRPKDCPPCFDCNRSDFTCQQFANCSQASGRCECPPGFGGEDCSKPLCGSLADGNNRSPRNKQKCQCKDGWEGVNCNTCQTNDACRPFMPGDQKDNAVCYTDGVVVNENFQMCNITNKKIVDQLKHDGIPQATFSCNAARKDCNFQFWVKQKESFYCALDECEWSREETNNRNTTTYKCEHLKCKCVPDRMLCGAKGGVDLTDFLEQSIQGPASFKTIKTDGGSDRDGSVFSEPNMNDLIGQIFGDPSIYLDCRGGECLHNTEVPGYERPIKKINTPLIAGVIAGLALFILAVILLVFLLNRRRAARYGRVRLDTDEEEENARLLADHKPAALYFENVHYELKGKKILSDIAGAVHPGELLAIMGASGAGKTSFLDILARKKKRGMAMGDFWLNGEKVSNDDFRSVIGFVDQDDAMLPTLTVHETILDSALLRLPKEMSRNAKEQKVEDVERQLGIYNIRHQLIDSEEGAGRGISGGEKRRVGIACELVTSPSILFLDEPTSGLDAYNAFNVVECLVTLVKTYNRTVVFTIHQPRSNIVALFDQLMLLAEGRLVYSGPFNRCQSYFDSIGYSCPPGFNIADYLVDLTMHAGTPVESEDDDEDDPSYLSSIENGRMTRASSTMAVKSVPSVSGSIEDRSSVRPKASRKSSVRQQQERQLYSRRDTSENTHTPTSVRSAGDSILERDPDSVRLRQQPPPSLSDSHALPPTADIPTSNLDHLVAAFAESSVSSDLHASIEHATTTPSSEPNGGGGQPNGTLSHPLKVRGYRKPHLPTQFLILSRRTWRNLYRNPLLMLTHYATALVLAVLTGYLYYGLTDDIEGFQNRLGCFLFLLALFGFSTLTSLTVFAPERLLFLRERAKGYYHPLSYYLAKLVLDIVPLRILPPIVMGAIVYPMTGLLPHWPEFAKFIMFIVLFNLAAATVVLFIGICVKNQGVANLLGVLVMLFSLLFGGTLLNHKTIPGPARWLQQISADGAMQLSIFHFAFEGMIVNEVRTLSLEDKKYGLDIQVPGSTILSSFGFNNLALKDDAAGLAIFCAVFLVLGYAALHVLLVEKR
ncbi:FAD-dependent urate hydroxylase [Saxophila tyrrhenica]|uniref:FAD-dependent urate hydroxylase n=1 Tax=Saxophila tyrrhenica TaxID=1690608 RepID=A0AAV9NTT8_9PEZI|nr:FAD-dependent urate hydroxylase [Saxophila tyrrhenica]